MLAKSQIKLIRSLQQKKYRNQHGLFFVEGKKVVQELLASYFKPYAIYGTDEISLGGMQVPFTKVTTAELGQMSALKNPNEVLGVFYKSIPQKVDFNDWIVALDDIRDPGNLGTIIRLCDWFGIQHLVCSKNTVDCYNPKVLQATMGSISRVHISYVSLTDFLSEAEVSIYGTFMDGESVYTTKLPEKGIVILGNEANGISTAIEMLTSQRITIPQYGKKTTESLNVATATAILLNEIRRF